MKFYQLLICLLISTSFGCKKDDTPTQTKEEGIYLPVRDLYLRNEVTPEEVKSSTGTYSIEFTNKDAQFIGELIEEFKTIKDLNGETGYYIKAKNNFSVYLLNAPYKDENNHEISGNNKIIFHDHKSNYCVFEKSVVDSFEPWAITPQDTTYCVIH